MEISKPEIEITTTVDNDGVKCTKGVFKTGVTFYTDASNNESSVASLNTIQGIGMVVNNGTNQLIEECLKTVKEDFNTAFNYSVNKDAKGSKQPDNRTDKKSDKTSALRTISLTCTCKYPQGVCKSSSTDVIMLRGLIGKGVVVKSEGCMDVVGFTTVIKTDLSDKVLCDYLNCYLDNSVSPFISISTLDNDVVLDDIPNYITRQSIEDEPKYICYHITFAYRYARRVPNKVLTWLTTPPLHNNTKGVMCVRTNKHINSVIELLYNYVVDLELLSITELSDKCCSRGDIPIQVV